MKNIIAAFIALASCWTAAFSQSSHETRTYFGIRLGGEVTIPGEIKSGNVGVSMFSEGGGMEIGGICNVPVAASFYIEPGIKFYYNNYSVGKDFLDEIEPGLDKMTFEKYGMRIPVMAGYRIYLKNDMRLNLFTGPELEFGFSARQKASSHGVDVSASIYGEDGGLRRADILWTIGVGLDIKKFYIGLSGSAGMLNMIDEQDVSFHENRMTLSVGYNF